MILALLLLAVGVASPDPIHAVLVSPTGSVNVVDLPLSDEQPTRIAHAWVWSTGTPVLRVQPEDLRDLVALRRRFTVNRAEIEVNVQSARRTDTSFTLICAPARMWDEVPEELLPQTTVERQSKVPVERTGGDVRLRAFNAEGSSLWTTAAATSPTISLAIHPAADLTIEVTGDRSRIRQAMLELLEPGTAMRAPVPLVRFGSTGSGIRIRAAPPLNRIIAGISGEGHVSRVFEGPLLDLPRRTVLQPGVQLTGRFVNGKHDPVPAVEAVVEWWFSPRIPHVARRVATSGKDGRWLFSGLAAGETVLLVDTEGFARVQRHLTLASHRVDLGDVVLEPAAQLRVFVRDGRKPVAGAVTRVSGRDTVTDDDGLAVVSRIDPNAPLRILVTAGGYLPAAFTLEPEIPKEHLIQLEPSFRLHGRLVDEDRRSVSADLQIVTGRREREAGDVDGTFSIDVSPRTDLELVFSAADREELRVPVTAGEPGETRDLGEIVLKRGTVITGTVFSAEDWKPVPGASVWTLRAAASIVSWARQQTLNTSTGADGNFRLGGCELLPQVIRIDAPGYARAHLLVDPRDSADTGTVALSRGVTVRVASPEGSVSRLDLRGEENEADVISAVAEGGVAVIRHVPSGTIHLSVWKGPALLCEKVLDVPSDRSTFDTECSNELPLVRGEVLVAGNGASGILQWQLQRRAINGLIVGHTSEGGLVQQQVLGETPASIVVAVSSSGKFSTRELAQGRWRVVWLPDAGGASSPKEVQITSEREQHVVLAYGARAIRGRVVDAHGDPAGLATVTIADSSASAMTDLSGSFTLAGLEPGRYSVRARQRSKASSPQTIEIEHADAEGIELRLDEDATTAVTVSISSRTGEAASGTLVFLETDAGLRYTASANSNGTAEFHLPPGAGGRRRAAALSRGSWAFGNWSIAEHLALELTTTGDVVINSERLGGAVHVIGASGWNVMALLASLGAPSAVAANRPLRVSGLPPGEWLIAVGDVQQTVFVRSDDVTNVRFR